MNNAQEYLQQGLDGQLSETDLKILEQRCDHDAEFHDTLITAWRTHALLNAHSSHAPTFAQQALKRCCDQSNRDGQGFAHTISQQLVQAQKKRRRMFIFFSTLCTAAALLLIFLLPSPPLATVSSNGTGLFCQRGNTTVLLDHESPLYAGDILELQHEHEQSVTLEDGSFFLLSHSAKITINTALAIHLHHGELYASIQPHASDAPLIITTNTAVNTITGTSFHLQSTEQQQTLQLLEGHVRIRSLADNSAYDLSAGEVMTVGPTSSSVSNSRYAFYADTPHNLEEGKKQQSTPAFIRTVRKENRQRDRLDISVEDLPPFSLVENGIVRLRYRVKHQGDIFLRFMLLNTDTHSKEWVYYTWSVSDEECGRWLLHDIPLTTIKGQSDGFNFTLPCTGWDISGDWKQTQTIDLQSLWVLNSTTKKE